jgi:D-arabinose 1-dehydrogenase-like Zn-dependent alcohol dehydrogenase
VFHDINALLGLLRRDGNLTLVGAPEKPLQVAAFSLLFGRRSLSGSPIGGTVKTQEMLDFCGQHNLTADVEVIPIQKVNEAYDRPPYPLTGSQKTGLLSSPLFQDTSGTWPSTIGLT